MMIYLEYERQKSKFREIQERFDEVLTEHERLFTKALPKAITYDRDHVQTSPNADMLADYVISEEEKEIDKKLKRMERALKYRIKLLNAKEQELRLSKNKYDKIYTLKYLEGMSNQIIANTLHYSISQVYRMTENIKKRI